jgi:hypothetical protein
MTGRIGKFRSLLVQGRPRTLAFKSGTPPGPTLRRPSITCGKWRSVRPNSLGRAADLAQPADTIVFQVEGKSTSIDFPRSLSRLPFPVCSVATGASTQPRTAARSGPPVMSPGTESVVPTKSPRVEWPSKLSVARTTRAAGIELSMKHAPARVQSRVKSTGTGDAGGTGRPATRGGATDWTTGPAGIDASAQARAGTARQ